MLNNAEPGSVPQSTAHAAPQATGLSDQIWVAGQAGCDRYRRVGHGIDAASLVQVGRPQLAGLTAAPACRAEGAPTVLRGPTWEGRTEDACHTSLTGMGEPIPAAPYHTGTALPAPGAARPLETAAEGAA
jgi:hypothetical protein